MFQSRGSRENSVRDVCVILCGGWTKSVTSSEGCEGSEGYLTCIHAGL